MFECSGKAGKLLRHSYPKTCPVRGKLQASTECMSLATMPIKRMREVESYSDSLITAASDTAASSLIP